MKSCNNPKCLENNPQPLTEFYKGKTYRGNLRARCKSCINFANHKWQRNNVEKCTEYSRRYREKYPEDPKVKKIRHEDWSARNPDKVRNNALKSAYGITLEEEQRMIKAQNGCCAICKKPETVKDYRLDRVKNLCVDHNHDTLKVRGLLCSRHNKALGLFDDNIELLQQAIEYLRLNDEIVDTTHQTNPQEPQEK